MYLQLPDFWECGHFSTVSEQVEIFILIHPLSNWHNFSSSNLRSNRNLPIVEDSYYLRRNQSFYIHVLNDGADQEEVGSLFLSNFYSKVLNAVAITRSKSKDSFLVWTKSPCDSVPPKLASFWTKSSGFRQEYNIPNITNSQIMCQHHI